MSENDKEAGCLGCGCLIVILCILLTIGYFSDKYSCQKTADTLGYKCEYSIWTECVLIKPDGKKVLLKQLRDFEKE